MPRGLNDALILEMSLRSIEELRLIGGERGHCKFIPLGLQSLRVATRATEPRCFLEERPFGGLDAPRSPTLPAASYLKGWL